MTDNQLSNSQSSYTVPCPIVLVGLMGAGKSTVGRRLANTMELPFVDSDNEIVEAAGCSISDIFESYGESIFRDLEQRVILRLITGEPSVIATGGGAFIQPTIREAIAKNAISVWLRAELPVLLERVSRRDNRPLLRTGDKSEILQKLINDRYPIYEKANITVDSGYGSHELVVADIISALKGYDRVGNG